MKKLELLLCIFFLTGIINTGFSQRNMNQKQFKSKSNDNNKYLETNAGLLDNDNSGYQMNNLPKIQQYVKDNEVVLDIHALMNVKADHFLAVFNLTQIGETTAKTNELINLRIDSFVTAVKRLGISSKDIYIDMIYLVPTFEFEVEKKLFSKTYNEVPTGFEMQKNVHITFKDINTVEKLVTLASKCEIYDLVKVDFFVDNTEAVYDTLRNKAVSCLNKKLSAFKKLNLTLSDKYQILRENSYTIYPETQYPDYDAFVSQSIEAVSKKTGVTKIRKPKTVAYDQIPYNQYDIIINPEILEPVVQFVYSLQVKYTLEKPEVKTKNNYMLVTPNGEVKKLDVQ
jgi:uncharacterized protein YggE